MTLTVRRVVTGHDENGRANVLIDEISKKIVQIISAIAATVAASRKAITPRTFT